MPEEAALGRPGETVRAREVAESFDSDAGGYERARPNYPDELTAPIAAVSRGAKMLDVGCGTGIAVRQLQADGCRVLGIDADYGMAELGCRAGLDIACQALVTF